MGTKQPHSRTLFESINLKTGTKMGPFLGFFLGSFLVRTHLSWSLFSLKAVYAYPAQEKCVVWENISAPGARCAPGHVVEREKVDFSCLAFWQPPVPVDSGWRILLDPQVVLCSTWGTRL